MSAINLIDSLDSAERLNAPFFYPDQVLTHTDLNGMVEYLSGQHRLTRRLLLGTGIVTGFGVSITPALTQVSVKLLPGSAITSEGHLIRSSEPKWLYNPLEVTDVSVFAGLPQNTPVPNGAILEVLATPVREDEASPKLSKEDLEGRVLVIYHQRFVRGEEKCFTTDCYDASASITFALRYLLIKKEQIDFWSRSGTLHGMGEAPPLADLKMPEVVFSADALSSHSNLQEAYTNVILGPFADALDENLRNLDILLKPWLSGGVRLWDYTQYPTLRNWLEKQLDGLPDQPYSAQYVYDLMRDVTDAYRELRDRVLELLILRHKEVAPHPRHIMVGHFDGSAEFSHYRYRHHGRQRKSEHDARRLHEDLPNRWHRIRLLLWSFSLHTDDTLEVRITPSAYHQAPLGERAVPFYFDHQRDPTPPGGLHWLTVWPGTFHRNEAQPLARISGYWWHENTQPPTFASDPLGFVMGKRSFFRIEGLQGLPLAQVRKDLSHPEGGAVPTHNLPFDVVYVPLTEADYVGPKAEKQGLPPGFNDLQEHYRAHKAHFHRSLQDVHWLGQEIGDWLEGTDAEGTPIDALFLNTLAANGETADAFSQAVFDILRQEFSRLREAFAGLQNSLTECLSEFDFDAFQEYWQASIPRFAELLLGSPYLKVSVAQAKALKDSIEAMSSAGQVDTYQYITLPASLPDSGEVTIQLGVGMLRQVAQWLKDSEDDTAEEAPYLQSWLRTLLPEAFNRGVHILLRSSARVVYRKFQMLHTHYRLRLAQITGAETRSLATYWEAHPALRHRAGTQQQGTFVVVYSQVEETPTVVADFTLPYRCCGEQAPLPATCKQPTLTAYPEFIIARQGFPLRIDVRDWGLDPQQVVIGPRARLGARGTVSVDEDGIITYFVPRPSRPITPEPITLDPAILDDTPTTNPDPTDPGWIDPAPFDPDNWDPDLTDPFTNPLDPNNPLTNPFDPGWTDPINPDLIDGIEGDMIKPIYPTDLGWTDPINPDYLNLQGTTNELEAESLSLLSNIQLSDTQLTKSDGLTADTKLSYTTTARTLQDITRVVELPYLEEPGKPPFIGFDVIPFTLLSPEHNLRDSSFLHIWVWDGIEGNLRPNDDHFCAVSGATHRFDVVLNDGLLDLSEFSLEVKDQAGQWIQTLNQAISVGRGTVYIRPATGPQENQLREIPNYKALDFAWNTPTEVPLTFQYRISQHGREPVEATVTVDWIRAKDDRFMLANTQVSQVIHPLDNDLLSDNCPFFLRWSPTGGDAFQNSKSPEIITANGTRLFVTDKRIQRLNPGTFSNPWDPSYLFWCNKHENNRYYDSFFYRLYQGNGYTEAKVELFFKPDLVDEALSFAEKATESELLFEALEKNVWMEQFPILIDGPAEGSHGTFRYIQGGGTVPPRIGYTPNTCSLEGALVEEITFTLKQDDQEAQGTLTLTIEPVLFWASEDTSVALGQLRLLAPTQFCHQTSQPLTWQAQWSQTLANKAYQAYYSPYLGKVLKDEADNEYRIYRHPDGQYLRTVVPGNGGAPYVEFRNAIYRGTTYVSLLISQEGLEPMAPSISVDLLPLPGRSTLLSYVAGFRDEFVALEERLTRPRALAAHHEGQRVFVADHRVVDEVAESRILAFDLRPPGLDLIGNTYGLRQPFWMSTSAAGWGKPIPMISSMQVARWKGQDLLFVASETAPFLQAFTLEGNPVEEWEKAWPPAPEMALEEFIDPDAGLRGIAIAPGTTQEDSDTIVVLHPNGKEKGLGIFYFVGEATKVLPSYQDPQELLPVGSELTFSWALVRDLAINPAGNLLITGDQGTFIIGGELSQYKPEAGHRATASGYEFIVGTRQNTRLTLFRRTKGGWDAYRYGNEQGSFDNLSSLEVYNRGTAELPEYHLLVAESFRKEDMLSPGGITQMRILPPDAELIFRTEPQLDINDLPLITDLPTEPILFPTYPLPEDDPNPFINPDGTVTDPMPDLKESDLTEIDPTKLDLSDTDFTRLDTSTLDLSDADLSKLDPNKLNLGDSDSLIDPGFSSGLDIGGE